MLGQLAGRDEGARAPGTNDTFDYPNAYAPSYVIFKTPSIVTPASTTKVRIWVYFTGNST